MITIDQNMLNLLRARKTTIILAAVISTAAKASMCDQSNLPDNSPANLQAIHVNRTRDNKRFPGWQYTHESDGKAGKQSIVAQIVFEENGATILYEDKRDSKNNFQTSFDLRKYGKSDPKPPQLLDDEKNYEPVREDVYYESSGYEPAKRIFYALVLTFALKRDRGWFYTQLDKSKPHGNPRIKIPYPGKNGMEAWKKSLFKIIKSGDGSLVQTVWQGVCGHCEGNQYEETQEPKFNNGASFCAHCCATGSNWQKLSEKEDLSDRVGKAIDGRLSREAAKAAATVSKVAKADARLRPPSADKHRYSGDK